MSVSVCASVRSPSGAGLSVLLFNTAAFTDNKQAAGQYPESRVKTCL